MEKVLTIERKLFTLEALIALFFFLLLFFGKGFSKFQIAGPIYLHDLLLGFITLLSINNRRNIVLRYPSLLLLCTIAVIYLIYSLLAYKPAGELLKLTFRQFNLFLYLICSYIIFNLLIKTYHDFARVLSLIKQIALGSVILQITYLIYGLVFLPEFTLFSSGASEYNYFSPLIIMGIITYGAVVLAYEQTVLQKIFKFTGVILLSLTFGHSSAFFAVFVTLLIYFFIRITPLQRLIALGIMLTCILALLLLPQFKDANASWRLLYWKHILDRGIFDRYFLFGHGFGQPYMTYEYAVFLKDSLNSPIMIDELYPWARYLSPPHNSLLSIVFHVGILPALLLFVPMISYFKHLFFKSTPSNPDKRLLIFALTGSLVWISFNVILELPHSATYFWLVYFAASYGLKIKR